MPAVRADRAEPQWARRGGAPSLYIGPWQELTLGRALKHRHSGPPPPPHAAGEPNGSSSSAHPQELSQFVTAFKELAETLDEEGARNLLLWSPLFMPTVDGLMRGPGAAAPGAGKAHRTRLRAGLPREVRNPAPHPRAAEAAAERAQHLAKLKQMYSQGPSADDGELRPPPRPEPPAAPEAPPLPPSHAGGSQRRPASPGATVAHGVPGDGIGDDWEDEVDDLLQWTTGLPELALADQ